MSEYQQANRPVRIATPLGEDVLLFNKLTGREELGRLFQYELVLRSEKHDLDYKEIIGKNVTVEVDKGDHQPRYYNGYISRFGQTNYEKKLVEYRATMVPWLWFLTRSSDCRIFQNLTIPEIIKQVFDEHGFSDVLNRLHGTYQPWEYCVQYRESAFDFVSRLMEQEGIYYFFKHENGKHSLVLCDTMGSHLEFKGYEELKFRLKGDKPAPYESIWSWVEQHEVQPGGYTVKDFDFKKPRRDAPANTSLDRGHGGSEFEQFDYLGEMDAECDTERYSKVRLEEWHARHELFSGEGDARGICTGVRFTLRGHPRADFEKEYLTVGSEVHIESDSFETVQEAKNEFVYEAKLTALPVTEQHRSARTTRKPFIRGPQTAMIVGPSGEEIYTDKYGRVKVQFHWDRQGKADENASCWVRVAQTSAGKQWGAVSIPRIGQEVLVEFLDGDPDRPIITGRVYNELALPPYELPANKTISTIRSNSSKGGQGFNEIRFDDNKDSEQIFVHAQKDQELRTKNDVKEWIGNERHLIVKKDQLEIVEGAKHSTVKGDHLSKIEGDRGKTVKGDHLIEVDGAAHLTVKGDQKGKVSGEVHFKGEKTVNYESGAKLSIKAGGDFHEKAAQNYAMDAGQNLHIKAGMNVVIEAGLKLSLKVGGNFVDIGPSGVAINGTMVMVNSGGSPASGSGSSPESAAAPEAPDAPKEPVEAADVKPGDKDEPIPAPEAPKPATYSASTPASSSDSAAPAQAQVLRQAAQDGTPFCEECEKARQAEEAGALA